MVKICIKITAGYAPLYPIEAVASSTILINHLYAYIHCTHMFTSYAIRISILTKVCGHMCVFWLCEHVSCCLAEAVNEVANSRVWICSLLPQLCDPSLARAGPPFQLSFILLILSGVMKMDQMKTQKHPLCPQPAPADWRQQVRARSGDYPETQNVRGLTHTEKKNSHTDGPN